MNKDLLKKLLETHGPSGSEGSVRDLIKKQMKPHVSEMYTDKFGNLIARKKGKGVSVMLVAHMDEIGVMVKSISKDGKVFISPIGGIEPVTILGENVRIITRKKKEINGVITTRDIQDSTELTTLPAMEDLYIDAGLTKEELERLGVSAGDYVHIMKKCVELGDGALISGKAMDDRIGCFILTELAKKLKKTKCEVYYVFTVQEEIGLYGAKTSVYSINPDYAVILDVTESDDGGQELPRKCVGKGPVIVMKDAEMITNRCMNDWFFDIAKKNKINIQAEVGSFGTTDALNISVSKGGIPCTVLGVAVRNIHTTTSVASLDDINGVIKLIDVLLKKPPRVCL